MDMHKNPLNHKTYDEIKGLLGTKVEVVDDSNYLSATILAELPTSYDARSTGCVHAIRD